MKRTHPCILNALHMLLPLLVAGMFFSGCIINIDPDDNDTIRGSGLLEDETINVSDFSAVSMAIPGELYITQGAEESLVIAAQGNLLPYIDIFVEEGRLYIETRDNINIQPTRPIDIQLSVKSLDDLVFAGTGFVHVDSLATTRFNLTLAGSGDVTVKQLTAVFLETTLAGSGDIQLIGTIDAHEINLAGSGDIEARELESDEVDIEIAGSGTAYLNVSESLRATIVGSGSVLYLGNPVVETTVVGSGTVGPL